MYTRCHIEQKQNKKNQKLNLNTMEISAVGFFAISVFRIVTVHEKILLFFWCIMIFIPF